MVLAPPRFEAATAIIAMEAAPFQTALLTGSPLCGNLN